jgi:hypothetical protein
MPHTWAQISARKFVVMKPRTAGPGCIVVAHTATENTANDLVERLNKLHFIEQGGALEAWSPYGIRRNRTALPGVIEVQRKEETSA